MRRTIDQWFTDQRGVVAGWQLLADGYSRGEVRGAVRSMREVHSGVYLSGHAPPTDWQRFRAATLTTPATVLGEWSALVHHGIRESDRGETIVVRPGSGGRMVIGDRSNPDRLEPFTVVRSTVLWPDVVQVDGILLPSAGRVVLDLLPQLSHERGARLIRDSLRLKATTAVDLHMLSGRHRGRRGVGRLRELSQLYAPLPLAETKSDAEALGLEILHAAGVELPLVNRMWAGEEADYCWLDQMRILELDGPQYHQFAAEDARKQEIWEAAGFRVDRLPTDAIYNEPWRLLQVTPDSNVKLWLPATPQIDVRPQTRR